MTTTTTPTKRVRVAAPRVNNGKECLRIPKTLETLASQSHNARLCHGRTTTKPCVAPAALPHVARVSPPWRCIIHRRCVWTASPARHLPELRPRFVACSANFVDEPVLRTPWPLAAMAACMVPSPPLACCASSARCVCGHHPTFTSWTSAAALDASCLLRTSRSLESAPVALRSTPTSFAWVVPACAWKGNKQRGLVITATVHFAAWSYGRSAHELCKRARYGNHPYAQDKPPHSTLKAQYGCAYQRTCPSSSAAYPDRSSQDDARHAHGQSIVVALVAGLGCLGNPSLRRRRCHHWGGSACALQ